MPLSRDAGNVYLVGEDRRVTHASANATTSGGEVIISVNTTGCESFAITNFGSINIYVMGSFDNSFFQPSVAVYRVGQNGGAGALTSGVECVSASTAATFNGPYQIVRVLANSGSGVYRASLTYR